MKQRGLALRVKQLVDRSVAAAAIVATAPIMLATTALVRLTLGSPALFRQKRPGKGGEIFELVKFRTMTDARGADGKLLPDAQRMHPVGAFLRRSSLDELPQLFNVLRGDLSLVGPRPLLVQYLERYSPEQARRHEVLPGITGWAQVNGRNALSWERKFELDVWYVDHWSLLLDAKILALTVLRVVDREGISSAQHVTMPEFGGSR